MRLISLDYLFAGAVVFASVVFGSNAALKIEDTLHHGSKQQSPLKFVLGERRYLITNKDGCLGSLKVRAGGDSVIAVLVNGKIRLKRDQQVANASIDSSFGFNPLLQLYEATLDISLESQRLINVKLKNVRPHDVTINGLFGENPINFAAPGPITLSRNSEKDSFTVNPPDSLSFPTDISSFETLISKFGLQINLESSQSCDSPTALDLREIEGQLRSVLPKGVSL